MFKRSVCKKHLQSSSQISKVCVTDVLLFVSASILQAMSLLICAEMYQVMRLQHICELYIITQLQSMPSRELASTSLSIVSLLKKAKVLLSYNKEEYIYVHRY